MVGGIRSVDTRQQKWEKNNRLRALSVKSWSWGIRITRYRLYVDLVSTGSCSHCDRTRIIYAGMNKCASSAVDSHIREVAYEFDRYFGKFTRTWYAFIKNGPNCDAESENPKFISQRHERQLISNGHVSFVNNDAEYWAPTADEHIRRVRFFVVSGWQTRRSLPQIRMSPSSSK